MELIPLSSLPNQSVSFNVDGAYWNLHIYQSASFMCADVTRNGVSVASGVRCFGGIPLMQYRYMYAPNFGNFVFDSDVDFESFGTECNLYYLYQDEMQQLNELILTTA